MYEIKNLSIGYKKNTIIENINYTFPQTGVFYLYGENGAGKTTFIHTLTGNLKSLGGEYDKRFEQALYLIQDSELLSGLTGIENVRLITKKDLSVDEISVKAKNFGIESILTRVVKEYSYGEKMRLLFLSACLSDSSIIIFDEVDKGLDEKNIAAIREYLCDLGKSSLVIFTSHQKFDQQNYNTILFKEHQFIVERLNNIDTSNTETVGANRVKENFDRKLLYKATLNPIYNLCLSVFAIIMTVLTTILLLGSINKEFIVENETGYNYGYIQSRMGRGIYYSYCEELDNAIPNYLSFTYSSSSDLPPIEFKDDDLNYFFDGRYVDLDLLTNKPVQPDKDVFTIYPNTKCMKDFQKVYASIDGILDLPLRYDLQFSDYYIGEQNFSLEVKLGETAHDQNELNLAKIYYSGTAFKKAMSKYTVDVEGVSVPYLDYIGDNNNKSSFSYLEFVHTFNEEELLEYAEQVANGGHTGTVFLEYELPVYKIYSSKIKGTAINTNLFLILGYITLTFSFLTHIVSFFFIRKKTIKNYLLLRVLKYQKKDLFTYYISIYCIPFLCLITNVILTIVLGFSYQQYILIVISVLIATFTTIDDNRRPCQKLNNLKRSSGQA